MVSTIYICRFRSNNKYIIALNWTTHGMEFPAIDNVSDEQLATVRSVCTFAYSGMAVHVIDAPKQVPVWIEKAHGVDFYGIRAKQFVVCVKDPQHKVPVITSDLVKEADNVFGKLKLPSFYGWLGGSAGSWSGEPRLVVNEKKGEDENEKCSICWEADCDWKLHCAHKFHIQCIQIWANKGRDTCPLCRRIARF